VDDATLAALEHDNFIHSIGLIARLRPNGVVRRERGVALLASGVAMRLFNQVLIESDEAAATDVADAVETMRAGSYRFLVHLRSGADDRFVTLMADLGLVEPDPADLMPGMALHPIDDETAPPGELEIRRVDGKTALDDHIRVAAVGFELDESLIRSFLDPRLLDDHDTAFYVGYVEGEAVVVGAGLQSGRTIGVYNIATTHAARRRGYGAAMTRHVAAAGRAAGCDVAALQASEMGRPIYERLGYRTVVRYRAFIDPDRPTA
jgi:ribosomal protein S18 acetylase RimI-like enzyme